MNVQEECNLLMQELANLQEQRAGLRKRERNLKLREGVLDSMYQIRGGSEFQKHLSQYVPSRLMPTNVGKVSRVAWPFSYAFNFDFGTDPTYTSATRQTQSVQVTQEAAFIVTHMSLAARDNTEASLRAPLQIDIRDNQSTRFLNDVSIPIQMLGRDSNPTPLETGYLVMPNASLSVICSSWVPDGETNTTVGSGRFQIALFGVRVRVSDFGMVLQQTILPAPNAE